MSLLCLFSLVSFVVFCLIADASSHRWFFFVCCCLQNGGNSTRHRHSTRIYISAQIKEVFFCLITSELKSLTYFFVNNNASSSSSAALKLDFAVVDSSKLLDAERDVLDETNSVLLCRLMTSIGSASVTVLDDGVGDFGEAFTVVASSNSNDDWCVSCWSLSCCVADSCCDVESHERRRTPRNIKIIINITIFTNVCRLDWLLPLSMHSRFHRMMLLLFQKLVVECFSS